jgi:hypothetical protein
MPVLPTNDARSHHLVPCVNEYVVMWRNAGKSFSFTLLRSIGSPRNNTSGLWFQLVPWPLSKSFTLFHLPPLLFYSSSFSVVLLRCPWGFQLTACFLLGRIFFLIAIGMSDPLSFQQFDLGCHWLRLCMAAQFFIWGNVDQRIVNYFPKAPVHDFF